MLNIVILSHLPSSRSFYSSILNRYPNVKCIVIPYERTRGITYIPFKEIYKALSEATLKVEEIDMVLVSSNYGEPASTEFNERLFNFLLTYFYKACIIAIGNTPESLVKALEHKEFVKIMGQTINELQDKLLEEVLNQDDFRKRIFAVGDLRRLIEDKSDLKEHSFLPTKNIPVENHVLNKYKDDNMFFSIHRKIYKSSTPLNPFMIVMVPSIYHVINGKFALKKNHPNQPILYLQNVEGNHYILIRDQGGSSIIPEGTYTFVLFTNPAEMRLSALKEYNLDGKDFNSIAGFGEITFKKLATDSMITTIRNKSACFYVYDETDDLLQKFKNLSFKQRLADLKIPKESIASVSVQPQPQPQPPKIERSQSSRF